MIELGAVRKQHLRPSLPPVLDGISLRVRPGETWGLCGPGAAGKSLLLKIICGLVVPEAGTVLAARPIGMAFQNNALFDSLNVAENVAFPVRQQAAQTRDVSIDEAQLLAEVKSRLRAVGLGEHGDKMPSQLSGGQRKRVALARAVMAKPKLVIYDEPTAGLDPVTTAKIYDLLRRERDETGATVVVVSSDVTALLQFAPRVAMLYRGTLRYDGDARTIADSDDPVVRQFVRGETAGPL